MSEYGFTWGNVTVERTMQVEGRGRVVTIKTDAGKSIEVYVSEGGRSIRVFKGSQELRTELVCR